MTLGSKENYIIAAATKRETSLHRLDSWRGMPNNRLQDPARIGINGRFLNGIGKIF
jgi:hypothetical protein